MNKKQHILIVEDEESIRRGLCDVLTYHGFQVSFCETGASGLQAALQSDVQLLILDIMLPEMDGFEVCERIRSERPELPIIMLTAKSTEEDVLLGLSLGADDYIQKPFSISEVVLRVKALLRRSYRNYEMRELMLGDLLLDLENLCGRTQEGAQITFSAKEIEILRYLYEHSERPVSREELLDKVWGYARADAIETRTVDIHIARLRRKIEKDAQNPELLTTLRGRGYKLEVGS